MSSATVTSELRRLEEPKAIELFSKVLTDVATGHASVILQRNGTDLAAVISLDDLAVLREALMMKEAERLSSQIDWNAVKKHKPPQEWYDSDDNPFEPEPAP